MCPQVFLYNSALLLSQVTKSDLHDKQLIYTDMERSNSNYSKKNIVVVKCVDFESPYRIILFPSFVYFWEPLNPLSLSIVSVCIKC